MGWRGKWRVRGKTKDSGQQTKAPGRVESRLVDRLQPLSADWQHRGRIRGGAGSVPGGSLRRSSAHSSPVSMAACSVRQCWQARRFKTPQHCPSSVWSISASFGHRFRPDYTVPSRCCRNRRKSTKHGLLPVRPHAGALLRLRATVNNVRMVPGFFAPGRTLRRAPARQRFKRTPEKERPAMKSLLVPPATA